MRVCFLVMTVLMAGCDHREQDRKALPSGEDLYMHYKVSGEEDKETVTCLVQFKDGGPEGEGKALSEKESIELDGEKLPADSARLSGVYYETDKPLPEFAGQHALVFTSSDGKQYTEEFEFLPFTIGELPESVERKPFTIQLDDLSGNPARLRILLIDTAFMTNDVMEVVTVQNGQLTITQNMLKKLSSGRIFLELFHEEEHILKQKGKGGGLIQISYGLRRSFTLN